MPNEYDLPIPTINGTAITVDWLRADPRRIYRLLRTLVQQNLIGWRLLSGRVDLTGTGFGIYEVSESIFANQNGQIVRPLTQYQLADFGTPTLADVKPDKNGLRFEISDEDAAHNRIDDVMRKLRKTANRLTFQNDALALAAVASAVVKTQAASNGAWDADGTGVSGNPFLDAALASASIEEENQGYSADTVAVTPTLFAYAVSRAAILNFMPRESASNIIQTGGNAVRIADKTWVKTTNMPSGVDGVVLDSTMLGSMAFERLGGGYQGDPSDPNDGVESKQWREQGIDGLNVQARIVRAPMVQEPNSARILTGVSS